jgi:hypothetical protein
VLATGTGVFFYFRRRSPKSTSTSQPAAPKPSDIESQAPSTPHPVRNSAIVSDIAHSSASSQTAIPHPTDPGTVRRSTGHPQTFADWVEKTKEPSDTPERMPEHGSGFHIAPLDIKRNSAYAVSEAYSTPSPSPARAVSPEAMHLMSSLPKVSRAKPEATPVRQFTLTPLPPVPVTPEPTMRPGTRDSWGATSFRRAVLGAGETERAKEILAKVGGDMDMDGESEKGVEVKVKEEVVDEEKGTGLARSYSGAWP